MRGKYRIVLWQFGSLLASMALLVVLQKLYSDGFSQSFQSYVDAARPSATNENFSLEMLQTFSVASIGNDSLIQTFIFPLFLAVGVLVFVVFSLSNRISQLTKELKEVKEKLDA